MVGYQLDDEANHYIKNGCKSPNIWANYSDLTRPHPKWWFSKGNPMKSPYFRKIQGGEIL